ncbi:fumarylacetoacetate hydrolase family protein [Micromonospora sp. MA102]|uniref:fumarylacetoacetate hydrolase family protein n=1 Tax=Micromonospora sp. MA102 TaxID=2952755 RepID=UPI0021C87082|nr:fumarylacetoacetate hydrolase family protein [Micromonospora sp. MA102]
MRLLTLRQADGRTQAARLDGDDEGTAFTLPFPSVRHLLESGPGWAATAAATTEKISVTREQIGLLIPNPEKIICLGLNYETHIREMGRDVPQYPTLFAKYARSLIGPYDPVVLPTASQKVDWEAELGVVIGTPCRHVSPERAKEHIAGYTVINDVTARDWQRRTREFLSGKTFEATTPVGPYLVTPDELPTDLDLGIECSVDGEVMQSARTSDLLFDVAAIVSYISTIITLVPGDVIATGTPGGVGDGRDPKVYLRPGQVLRTTIEGIGTLENVCVAESA